MSDALSVARRLVEHYHFSVIPLDHPDDPIANEADQRGKVPACRWAAFQKAHPTDDNLRSWFANGHKRNVGIVTGSVSKIVVIDTDSEGAEAWAAEHLPATPVQVITKKGRHRYYRLLSGTPVPNKARIREGVDVRGDGGYAVGPGSVHSTGHVYRAPEPWPDSLDGVPVFDATWLGITNTGSRPSRDPVPRQEIQVRSGSHLPDRGRLLARVRAYLAKTPGAIEGQGGDLHTYQVACRIVRGFQLDPGDARDLLGEWNQTCVPPWSERELDAKIDSALRYGNEPMGGRAADRTLPRAHELRTDGATSFALTDTGNSEAFAAWHGDRVRWDRRRRRWLAWGEHRFTADAEAVVEQLAKDTIRRRLAEAMAIDDPDARKSAMRWAISSESRTRREAMLVLARSESPIASSGTEWDRDPWALCLPNGVLDLRTGSLRPGRPEDGHTMAAAVPFDPMARAPRWEQTVFDVFDGDADLIAHFHKACGYSLTAITTEQCLWVGHGKGSNGKGTLLNALLHVLGDYGYQMPFSTVLATRKDTATNDLAALDGRRFVLASEASDGARFDEGRIKTLTGCDSISARFLYSEFFTFVPVAKFWLAVNQKPVVRDDSHGFWRRIRLLPFVRTFPVNPHLASGLRDEAPGILAWAVRGCLQWQAEGLGLPSAVTVATEAYRRDSDVLGEFITDACDLTQPDSDVSASDLYRRYVTWAEQQGFSERERLSKTMFGRKASERFRKAHTSRGATYFGVSLK